MTAAVARANRALYNFGIRRHFRWRELRLLAVVAVTLLIGWTSLESFRTGQLSLGEAGLLVTYLAAVFVIHFAFVITGRRMHSSDTFIGSRSRAEPACSRPACRGLAAAGPR